MPVGCQILSVGVKYARGCTPQPVGEGAAKASRRVSQVSDQEQVEPGGIERADGLEEARCRTFWLMPGADDFDARRLWEHGVFFEGDDANAFALGQRRLDLAEETLARRG